MDQKNNKLIETVKASVLTTFNFLENNFLYVPMVKIEKSEIFIDSVDVEYHNEIKRRTIIVSYTRNTSSNLDRHTFTISILRQPYCGPEDFFSLEIYLKFLEIDFKTNFTGSFSKIEMDKILKEIANVLKKYAIEIVEGKIWREEYFPRKD